MSRAGVIREDLRRRIVSGEYAPGDRLPRVVDLMERYSTPSRSAVDRALRDLVAEGLVTVIQGSGSYVRRRDPVYRDLSAGLRLEYARAQAGDRVTGDLFTALTGAEAQVSVVYDWVWVTGGAATTLRLGAEAEMLVRSYRYKIDGVPHQAATSYLPADLARRAGLTGPGSERPELGTIAHLRAAGVEVAAASITIEARMPGARESARLAIEPGTPVFDVSRVLLSEIDDVPVEVSTAVVPADRVAYVMRVKLGGVV